MATKKAADHTLYHLAPRGFWKRFRDAVVVNPEISSGLPLPDKNRYPQPASRPERYATPATKASDPAQNPYWKRDVRRAYPQLSVVTQEELATFLLQKPEQPAVDAPTEGQQQPATSAEGASVPATRAPAVDLTAAIATITDARKAYSESRLPPTPPIAHRRWRPQDAPDAPHDPHAYFPMSLVK
ncbi:NADH dehydrogenase [Fomitiporia mediterranea MF3/22]|uniref:NADH dehydrogenase n=1 Tax=Fomitiporia mediterranea (strain MF3/22) TaxID=694068 RepID=UPI0004409CD2|nr:NADH dehydrogenase [Fomitiporia mediterranea MF3/22]EJD03298.1 NADH dehydrogenase [Fomitiporia mediterranea MF3/22]